MVVEASGKRAESSILIHRLAVVPDGQRRLLLCLACAGGSGQQLTVEPFGKACSRRSRWVFRCPATVPLPYVLVSEGDREQVAIVDLTASGGPSLKKKTAASSCQSDRGCVGGSGQLRWSVIVS